MSRCAYCGKDYPKRKYKSIFCSRGCANKDKAAWQRPAKRKKEAK